MGFPPSTPTMDVGEPTVPPLISRGPASLMLSWLMKLYTSQLDPRKKFLNDQLKQLPDGGGICFWASKTTLEVPWGLS